MHIPITKRRNRIYLGIIIITCVFLVINIFYPLIFIIDDDGYHRHIGFLIYFMLVIGYFMDSLCLYIKSVKKSGRMKSFPVWIFLVPVMIGITIQTMKYEISIAWASIAVALAGVMTALKNELIYRDSLTGLYNRAYLQFLQQKAHAMKNECFSGIMIDLNGFKQINDTYGHLQGDQALLIAADILNKSFSEYGVVIRNSGDEFIVLLNTKDDAFIETLIAKAKRNFEEYNKLKEKPYQLSASMGYATCNINEETMDDFINRIDQKMYEDKRVYYENIR